VRPKENRHYLLRSIGKIEKRDRASVLETEQSAAKLNQLRGLDADELGKPAIGNRLAVLAFVHINHAFDIIVKTVERDLAARGLSVARYAILRMLSGRPPVPLSWIADKHFSQRSNITAMVDRLVRDEMVERQPDPIDRRVIRVKLTDKGAELIEAARGPHLEFLAQIMSPLDDDELGTLIKLLEKLSAPYEDSGRPAAQSQIAGDYK
jgi:DNA-binding MarR family transcriptional regulator